MEGFTNNMVGLTDILEHEGLPTGQVQEKPLLFVNEEHKEYYHQIISETETSSEARERLALFYLLASIKKVRKNPARFFDFQEMKINRLAFKELLSPSEQALLQLAFHLYSEKDIFKISVRDLFNHLDQTGSLLALGAVRLRFNITG